MKSCLIKTGQVTWQNANLYLTNSCLMLACKATLRLFIVKQYMQDVQLSERINQLTISQLKHCVSMYHYYLMGHLGCTTKYQWLGMSVRCYQSITEPEMQPFLVKPDTYWPASPLAWPFVYPLWSYYNKYSLIIMI